VVFNSRVRRGLLRVPATLFHWTGANHCDSKQHTPRPQ
jgi:hypothetical protein